MTNQNAMEKYNKMDFDAYIKDRVDDQLSWLEGKSGLNKKYYHFWKLIVILLSVSIPLFVVMLDEMPIFKYVIAAAGVLIAAVEGILSLYKNQDNWINYRQTSEALRREKLMFLTKSGVYKNDPDFAVFVERVETILGDENQKWADYADNQVVLKGADSEEEG